MIQISWKSKDPLLHARTNTDDDDDDAVSDGTIATVYWRSLHTRSQNVLLEVRQARRSPNHKSIYFITHIVQQTSHIIMHTAENVAFAMHCKLGWPHIISAIWAVYLFI